MPRRTIARMTALSPGQSPPPVSTPKRATSVPPSALLEPDLLRDPGVLRLGLLRVRADLLHLGGVAGPRRSADLPRQVALPLQAGDEPVEVALELARRLERLHVLDRRAGDLDRALRQPLEVRGGLRLGLVGDLLVDAAADRVALGDELA